jgi:hypothetical protein
MKPGLVAATLLLLTAGLALAADPVTENWKDDEGDNMVLEVQPDSFTGIYDGGRVTGTLQKDGSYAGFWMEEDTSDTECADKRDGTPYWGRLIFKFDAKRQHFQGIYSDCDDKPDPSNIWNGDRLDDAAARQAPSSNADAASAPPTSSSSEMPPSAGAVSIASISSEAPVGVETSASVAAPASNDAASSGATPSQAPGPFKRHHH